MSNPEEVEQGVKQAGDAVLTAMTGVLRALGQFLSLLKDKKSPEAIAQLRQVAQQLDAGLTQSYNSNQNLLKLNSEVQKLPTLAGKVASSISKDDLRQQATVLNDEVTKFNNAMNTFKDSLKQAPKAPTPTAPRAGKS